MRGGITRGFGGGGEDEGEELVEVVVVGTGGAGQGEEVENEAADGYEMELVEFQEEAAVTRFDGSDLVGVVRFLVGDEFEEGGEFGREGRGQVHGVGSRVQLRIRETREVWRRVPSGCSTKTWERWVEVMRRMVPGRTVQTR